MQDMAKTGSNRIDDEDEIDSKIQANVRFKILQN